MEAINRQDICYNESKVLEKPPCAGPRKSDDIIHRNYNMFNFKIELEPTKCDTKIRRYTKKFSDYGKLMCD